MSASPLRDSTPDASVMRIDEARHLGRRLPGGLALEDAAGRTFHLADTRGKPLILLLSYYGCDASCPTMGVELALVLAKVTRFRLGADYRVLTVSFDRRDSARQAGAFLARNAALAGLPAEGWRHAVIKAEGGQDAAELATDVGFRFFWSDAAGAFLHPNVLIFVTPQGRIARYIYGTRMDPATIELALIDADWERIANSLAVFDQLTGACFSYNAAEGRYQLNYALLAGVGSLLLGLLLTGLGFWIHRRKIMEARHE
ncbi:SCO family protein [Denitratisoma sp. DHT3]|uniref:SCO family protein n=1 Tax=Denitratisoma sp. DHT3 TaxID=1981880 RepID=UPI0011A29D25|nr:SCO family protein [Denitratisoma sp. DHT3]